MEKNKYLGNNSMLVSLICVSSLVFAFLSHYTGFSLLMLMSLAIMSSGIFFLPKNNKLAILFCALPWIQVLKLDSSQPTLYHLLYFVFIFVLLKDLKKINIELLLFVLLLSIYVFVNRLLNQSGMEFGFIAYMLSLLFMVILFPNLKKYYNPVLCLNLFSFGLITGFIAERIYRNIPSMYVYLSTDTYASEATALRYAGLFNDTNITAMLVLIYLCLVLNILENIYLSKKQKIIIVLSALVVVFFTFFTVSKMFFLGIALIVFYTIYRNFRFLKFSKILKFSILTILLTYVSYMLGLFDSILYRINLATDLESLTTGRSSIIREYTKFLYNEERILFFGVGMYDRLYYQDISSHNTFITAIYQLGIIGLVFIYIPMYFSLLREAILSLKVNRVQKNLIAPAILGLGMMSLDILMFVGMPILILITLVCFMGQLNVYEGGDHIAKNIGDCTSL
ncbi:hypothetical protein [Cytobacillus firmus]|uniref:hypothetical protein n=1 Tax=Cytobacillus firmus TaxID=1399 RepID=UPI0018CD40AA|nr:hypothetical protein [Cytobacillus firmus]MBG9444258.1 hypothetical protein [Cytobacillus firmus]